MTEADFIEISSTTPPKVNGTKVHTNNRAIRKDTEMLEKLLKEFRLTTSRKENNKPYFIFDNKQMAEMIAKCPRNKEELLAVYGFGPKYLFLLP